MRKYVFLCIAMTVVMNGCSKKGETLEEGAVIRQCDIIVNEMESKMGKWSERIVDVRTVEKYVWPIDLDGDGIKELLPYVWGT